MTCIVAVRVPGVGCVLGCDSRVTVGTEILTDLCDKYFVAGPCAGAIAGYDGGLLQALVAAKGVDAVRAAALKYTEDREKLDWSALLYDQRADKLGYLDSSGAWLPLGSTAAQGCGAAYALGYLSGQPTPRTLDQAHALAEAAVKVAIRHDSACGGRVRAVRAPRGARSRCVVT